MALTFAGQILQGKTLGRVLFNAQVARYAPQLAGRVLDLAGGGSYEALLPTGFEVVRTNVVPDKGVPVDFNKPLPYADDSFDFVLLFNALYIAEDPPALMREIRRVLRSGGHVLIASPFLANEMREPHDYVRFTSEGLLRLLHGARFTRIELTPYGERFSTAANLLHDVWLFPLLRLPIYALACALDTIIPHKVHTLHPAPLGWFCVAEK